jgi:hypothetical protein
MKSSVTQSLFSRLATALLALGASSKASLTVQAI